MSILWSKNIFAFCYCFWEVVLNEFDEHGDIEHVEYVASTEYLRKCINSSLQDGTPITVELRRMTEEGDQDYYDLRDPSWTEYRMPKYAQVIGERAVKVMRECGLIS